VHLVTATPELRSEILDHEAHSEVRWHEHPDLAAFATRLRDWPADAPHPTLLVVAESSAAVSAPEIRELADHGRRVDCAVVVRTADAASYRSLLLAGAVAVVTLPLLPQGIDQLFNAEFGWRLLFPGDLGGSRRERHELRVPSRRDQVSALIRFVCERSEELGHEHDFVRSHLPLVVDEVVTNAMRHGHGWREDLEVEVEFEADAHSIRLVVRDQGEGFVREAVRDPLAAENRSREGGRGLFLVERIMNDVQYRDGGRTVELHYRRETAAPVCETAV
jgi:serine/threonine-protein kinase RsbW